MRWLHLAFIGLPMLASCGAVERQPEADRTASADRRNRIILSGSAVPVLLRQCSRASPDAGEATWQPAQAEVDRMEAVLPGALAAARQSRETSFSGLAGKWYRQYAGIVRGGKRYIYGNYLPIDSVNEALEWRLRPIIACDGGAAFFGAEFDITAGRITRLDFNGNI